MDNYLKESIESLRKLGKFANKDLEYPDLGDLPEGEGDEEEEEEEEDDDDDEEEEEEEEEEDEEDDDDDDDEGPKKTGKRGRPPAHLKNNKRPKVQEPVEEEKRKKRGRPPTVDKPHEHRIKAILRGVRKTKEPGTKRHLYPAFEKLPDPKLFPQYYAAIAHPMSLDVIRKNIKRRKYPHVEAFLADMNVMFQNVKRLNKEGSQMFKDAIALQKSMVYIAQDELAKPDSVYQDPDSSSKTARLPLDNIEHNGVIYRVGDWIHIANGNEGSPPTVGQIFRIWQTADGQQWINACWYYRPEQTVHRYDKLFYENEVVKSGQYRDHLVEEVLEKCFVMFFTRYQRGRPKGFEGSVYCCESRYNEHEKTFNKIRTWKACIPDEVRSTDYPMDMFEQHHPLRRVVSPIKNLLPADAKEDDPKPEPKLGVPNAPPIIGAVYKRPYDPNEPPEEPTPENWPEPRQAIMKKMVQSATSSMLSEMGESPSPGLKLVPHTLTPPNLGLKNGLLNGGSSYNNTPIKPSTPSPFINIESSNSYASQAPANSSALAAAFAGNIPTIPTHQTLPATAHAVSTVMQNSPYAPSPVSFSGSSTHVGYMGTAAAPSTAAVAAAAASQPCTFTLPEEVESMLDSQLTQNEVLGRLDMKVKIQPSAGQLASLLGEDQDVASPLPTAMLPGARTMIQKKVVWFNGPPLYIARRRVSEPVSRSLQMRFPQSLKSGAPRKTAAAAESNGGEAGLASGLPVPEEVEDESRNSVSLGHSAKYLVYRREKLNALQRQKDQGVESV